jgi:hypothetical protein
VHLSPPTATSIRASADGVMSNRAGGYGVSVEAKTALVRRFYEEVSVRGTLALFRFSNGKVVEIWNQRDDLGLMEQLGAPACAGALPE